jgi:PAS domain S-box-containing protein
MPMSQTEPTVDALLLEINELRRELSALRRGIAELELMLELTVEYSDDITEDLHAKVKETRREGEERFRLLFDHMLDGFVYYRVLLDENGQAVGTRFLEINAAFERLTGLKREDVIGKNIQALPEGGGDFDWVEVYSKVVASGGEGVTYEQYVVPLHKWFTISAYSPRKGYLATIFKDITQRKQAKETLTRQARELARSNAELERFAYVAAHHLQEPLITIGNYAQFLARRYGDRLDADADQFIHFLVDAAAHLKHLLRDLLAYSELDRWGDAFEMTSAEAVLKEVLARVEKTVEASQAVVTHDPLPVVTADARRLGKVFEHLIDNALKFHGRAPPQVHVSASSCETQEGAIGEGAWCFSVRDNGIGIAPEYTGRIFQVFERLHSREAYPGTGIGLATCKKIVESHGGRMWVESEPGQGATFYFTIPKGASD